MSKWNPWGEEVGREKAMLLDYGGIGSKTLPRCVDSYKAQALRMLALYQLAEERIQNLEDSMGAAIALVDGENGETLHKHNGMGVQWNQRLIDRIDRINR